MVIGRKSINLAEINIYFMIVKSQNISLVILLIKKSVYNFSFSLNWFIYSITNFSTYVCKYKVITFIVVIYGNNHLEIKGFKLFSVASCKSV